MSCKILQHGVHRLDIYRLIFFVRNGHETGYAYSGNKNFCHYTVNSRFKKDLKLQIHLHFSDGQFLDSLHKSFSNQTTVHLRKEK